MRLVDETWSQNAPPLEPLGDLKNIDIRGVALPPGQPMTEPEEGAISAARTPRPWIASHG